jgi:pimeloyl-ACP methyl ester carboxylesterase
MLRLKYTSMFSGLMAACALIMSVGTTGAEAVDVQNDVMDVTLFRGAGNNSWFEVYFKADLVNGADKVEVETLDIDLRPKRDVTLHVKIFNPDAKLPLIITPGGNGDTDGFGNFARNVAVAAPDFKVIIYDRRNLGRSSINFGDSPQMIEEGEDLHALIEHLDIAPATL